MRIGLCGTMSVGKTTLVNALKELPEFKDYVTRTERSKELMAMGIPLNTDSEIVMFDKYLLLGPNLLVQFIVKRRIKSGVSVWEDIANGFKPIQVFFRCLFSFQILFR